MSDLPFANLPLFQPRQFLPAGLNLGDWSQVAPFFERLEACLLKSSTAADLERCLVDWSELTAALGEESARRYIAMTCHTENSESKRAYRVFVENVHPHAQSRHFRLAQHFLSHPLRHEFPMRRYDVFVRDTATTVELFREENMPLESEEAKLAQEHLELTAAMNVPFRGEVRTLQEMNKFLEEPDRATRRESWELGTNRALADAEKLEGLFESLLRCRERQAANAGFKSYREYAWRRLRRFDYTPEQCAEFHAAIEQEILPVVRESQERRKMRLGVETLRPWDTEVDPDGAAPLRPFTAVQELLARTQRIFHRMDESLNRSFQRLQELKLLELEARKGKAPGGYQVPLPECRMPFICLSLVGVHMDVLTLLHEAGHAFHSLAAQEEPLLAYRNAPLEFCEVASQSMELIGSEHLDEFYAPADVRRARRTHLERILESFPWLAAVDAFQDWVYTHPSHTRTERAEAWVGLMERFGGVVDWTGYEPARANLWHDVGHFFQSPLCFVEYGIAWLGALQVWSNWKQDPNGTLAAYKRALALGGSRPLPELFAAAGCQFDFSAKALRPLAQLLRQELAALDPCIHELSVPFEARASAPTREKRFPLP
ncbi:MAG: M3 family oligoendopeptidase [Verrucomicrobia bacterium]|nr:M3 family oligoendopeptidase [Verrucomicrobiota bacterium]